jgi:hypothetical protein
MVMDPTSAAEARARVTKWIEEARQLFALLPELMAGDYQAGERASAAQKEAEKLHKEVEDLKRENHLLRLEKDEIAQAMSQIAAKLGITPRRSPFERGGAGEPAKPADHQRPPDAPLRTVEQPKAPDPAKS